VVITAQSRVPGVSARASRSLVVVVPAVWSLILSVVMLGPALAPGFVLVRDMVFVPHLDLGRSDVLGLGSALPRAVPSDAVVAVLDQLVGGMVLQKLVLVGSLAGAGIGAAVMVGGGMVQRVVASGVAIWNPFVVERLAIGHWPIVAGYAAIPWLVIAGRRVAHGGTIPLWLPAVLVAGSLSANAGLVSALVLLLTAAAEGVRRRRVALLALAVLATNAPWLIAGLVHASGSLTAGGYEAFSTRGDGLPGFLTVLTGGGIWNGAVVPGSRESALAWIGLLVAAAVAALGAKPWLRRHTRADARALIVLWLIGVGLAWMSLVAPNVLAVLGEHVPGLGLLRDGTRSLGLAMPLTVGLLASGAARIARWPRDRVGRIALVAAVTLAPVAALPDAAWGIGGELGTATYPASWLSARQLVTTSHGNAVVLPWSAYRAPVWNGGRPVQDPMPRLLHVDTVASSDLIVSGAVVAGEDRRARRVKAALDLPTVTERSRALLEEGIGWVVATSDAGGTDASQSPDVPEVQGTVVLRSADVLVVRLDGSPAAQPVSTAARLAQGGGWIAFVLVVLVAVARPLRVVVVKMITWRRGTATLA
jgi:hypothetical protein